MKPVYIVAAKRSALGKAKKGSLAKVRPDDLLAYVMQHTVASVQINPLDIGDVVIGCAFPEAEQGQNIARIASVLAGLPNSIPGMTINRYCSSGVNAIAIAANRIQSGEIEVAVAGGVESMSMIPMGGNDYSLSPQVFSKDENVAIAYGMGITAENVAKRWQVSRIDQDAFAVESHLKAAAAAHLFADEIIPYSFTSKQANLVTNQIQLKTTTIAVDEGIRPDTSAAGLAQLKPAFAQGGSVTAGNSSQLTDGAAALILVSENYLKRHNLTPLGRFISFAVAGVDPALMGIGPLKAIPQALAQARLSLAQIDWIELNEAFAAQSLAVIRDLNLNPAKVNPYGGAIALGHPLGATGAILTTKLLYALRRNNLRYGMVTMCIGTGMGAAAIFEAV